jgi:hypothetical protein
MTNETRDEDAPRMAVTVDEISDFIESYERDNGRLPSVAEVILALDPDAKHAASAGHGTRVITTASGSYTETSPGSTYEQDMKRGIWHGGWEAGSAGKPKSDNPY